MVLIALVNCSSLLTLPSFSFAVLIDRGPEKRKHKGHKISLQHFKPTQKQFIKCPLYYFCTDPRVIYFHRNLCATLHVVIHMFPEKNY